MKAQYTPGVTPEVKAPNPKLHPFTPYIPGSTKCKWCMFSIGAHNEIAPGAELHPEDQKKVESDRLFATQEGR